LAVLNYGNYHGNTDGLCLLVICKFTWDCSTESSILSENVNFKNFKLTSNKLAYL